MLLLHTWPSAPTVTCELERQVLDLVYCDIAVLWYIVFFLASVPFQFFEDRLTFCGAKPNLRRPAAAVGVLEKRYERIEKGVGVCGARCVWAAQGGGGTARL